MELNFVMCEKDVLLILNTVSEHYVFEDDLDRKNWEQLVQEFIKRDHIDFESLSKLLLCLKDPHTMLINTDFKYYRQCDLIWDGEALFLMEGDADELVASKIKEINGFKLSECMKIYLELYEGFPISAIKQMLIQDIKTCSENKLIHKDSVEFALDDGDKRVFDSVDFKDLINDTYKSISNPIPLLTKAVDEETKMIKILSFNSKELYEAIYSELNGCFNHLIFDLRHNLGGNIENTKKIASLFSKGTIDLGYKVLVGNQHSLNQVIPGHKNSLYKKEVTVFINEFTISSAEYIFTLSLKNSDNNVKILGRRSAGFKDQAKMFPINKSLILQVTVKKYINFKDSSYLGIEPDIHITNIPDVPYIVKDYFLDEWLKIKRMCV